MNEPTPPPELPAGSPRQRLWLFDDHKCFRELLADYLRTIPGVEVAGTGDDEEALLAAIDGGLVDLVLLDLDLDGPGGFFVLERIRQKNGAPPVLILSSHVTHHSMAMATRLGAAGYLQKTSPLDEFVPALAAVRAGHTYYGEGLPRQLAERVAREAGPSAGPDLDGREIELLRRLVRGVTVRQLATEWRLSRYTVYKSRTRLMRKIAAKNHQDLAAYARRNGLVDAPPNR